MNYERYFTRITPLIYVCSQTVILQSNSNLFRNIHCIINVADELPQISFPSHCGIESVKYPIRDQPNFPAHCYFDMIADRIAKNVKSNRRTLIYCQQGRSRSITFVLAYLIKYHRLPLGTAFQLVQHQRQIARPNIGFWQQLKSYDLCRQKRNKGLIEKIKTILRKHR